MHMMNPSPNYAGGMKRVAPVNGADAWLSRRSTGSTGSLDLQSLSAHSKALEKLRNGFAVRAAQWASLPHATQPQLRAPRARAAR